MMFTDGIIVYIKISKDSTKEILELIWANTQSTYQFYVQWPKRREREKDGKMINWQRPVYQGHRIQDQY